MPILVIPQPDDDIAQGDIFRDAVVYLSGVDGTPLLRQPSPPYVLVISRNCKALRDKNIVVCPVLETGLNYAASKTDFGDLLKELEVTRDGGPTPDRLYLGNIDGQARYAAHMDELYTLRLPEDASERRDYARAKRVAALSPDHRRDLHQRIFSCVARQGFNDETWFSDADLQLLLQRGAAQLHEAEAALATKKAALSAAEAEAPADRSNPAKLVGIRSQITKQEEVVSELRSKLEPLQKEAARRGLSI